jgi:hypothetical protein
MTIAAYRYKYADWQNKFLSNPGWRYVGHNCKDVLPDDAVIEPMYTQAYVQDLEQRCERLQSLYNSASCSS